MKAIRWQAIFGVAAVLAAVADVSAQPRGSQAPHVGYVYPAGGQLGTSFDVVVGGQWLKEGGRSAECVAEAFISGGGIKAKVVKWYKPLSQGENTRLSMRLRDTEEQLRKERLKKGIAEPLTREMIAKAAGVSEEELKEMEIYRKRRADPRRQPNVQIEEELTVRIEIAPDAEVSNRELRIVTPAGMSNPAWFYVDRWPESKETEPNDVQPDSTMIYKLPAVINGQCYPGDKDRFRFTARKGTHLVIDAAARALVPYLADAVPGWFQAVLTLYDSDGKELAYAGAFHFRQDPVIHYEVPKDGEYMVEIHDSIYRGREDFVYRISLGELPFVTGMFPLGGRAGTEVGVELAGWNLVNNKLNVNAVVDRGRPLRWFLVPQADQVNVRVPLLVDMMSECMDEEPNDTPEEAQALTMPTIVNGRIEKPDDVDVYRFEGFGKFVAEVCARRYGSPLDSSLTLTDANGKELAFNDDYEDKAQPLITHHADSRIVATLPGQGTYYLTVRDAQRAGGPDFVYRLHIRPPRPDFELRIVPSSITARAGTSVPIAAYAVRRDGFDEDIQLSLVKPPRGFRLDSPMIPGNQDKVMLTLTVPETAGAEPISLEVDGQNMGTRGRKILHAAVPAEDMMQAFAYRHLVPTKDWTVLVHGKAEPKMPLAFAPGERIRLPLGGTTKLRAALVEKVRRPGTTELTMELSEPPNGIAIDKVTPIAGGLEVVLSADAGATKEGLRGNLIFRAIREYTPPAVEGKPAPKPQKTQLGYLPAVPFEVIGKAARAKAN